MLVTIGLCVRNCEATIKDTIESIANQDFPQELIEVIVVDDDSRDRTVHIAKDEFSKTEIMMKVFRTDGSGLGEARQIVVANAKGKYVVWLDGDMTLSKDHIQKQLGFMETHPLVGKTRGKWRWRRQDSLIAHLESMKLFNYESRHSSTRFAGSRLLGIGGSICRLKALREVGGFDPQIKGAGEDIDIAAKLLTAGWHLEFSDAEFYHGFKETWVDLWNQYFWYGYGAHYVNHKHKGLILVWTMTPVVAFFTSLLQSISVYRFTLSQVFFLLPFQNAFKYLAWCLGFLKGHLRNYGHPD